MARGVSARGILALLAMLAVAVPLSAAARLDDPELRDRARSLFREMRCVVCQSEPIATSNAEMAADMRQLIRDQLRAGKRDAEIKAYLRRRYGDYVLLNPPVQPTTYVLWYGPAGILILGLIGVAIFLRRMRARWRVEGDAAPAAREETGPGADSRRDG